ncbi:MAG: glutaredoxin family protein [Gammaproteobacteria bacterium]|nr:glutaredoxin family protein [Gammaproteobacteria bacterium]
MPVLDVYSRKGCHLCEVLVEQLLDLVRGHADVVVHDVDSCEDWCAEYGLRVPVVEYRGTQLCEFTLDRGIVMAALAAKG